MAIPNLPARMIPAHRALGIVSKISGVSEAHIKEKFKQFNSPEARKIIHNATKNKITQKEMTTLLQQTKKAGLNINSNKLASEYSKINQEEIKRKIQYTQQRGELTNRLAILKSGGGGEGITREDRLRARIFSTSEISNVRKIDQPQSTSQQINNSGWGAPSADDSNKNKDSHSGKVIDLPI